MSTQASITTTATRVKRDIGAKLDAICRYDGVRASDLLDPLIRRAIEKRFDALPAEFRQKALERAGLTE